MQSVVPPQLPEPAIRVEFTKEEEEGEETFTLAFGVGIAILQLESTLACFHSILAGACAIGIEASGGTDRQRQSDK